MVLRRKYNAFHARKLADLNPLAAVKISRIEKLGIFVAVSPFGICESVDAKMEKSIKFKLLPFDLPLARNYSGGVFDIIWCAAHG